MRLLFFLLPFLLSFSCSNPTPPPTIAFYWWNTEFQLEDTHRQFWDISGAQHLYLRLFDVDLENGQPQPIGPLQWTDTLPPHWEATPVVFITNRTLEGMSPTQTASLGEKISQKARELWPAHRPLRALQLDCDWTTSTRDAYFHLLQSLPDSLHLSATIRLHQVKYFEKTGIPPVNSGVLMYYNMGDVADTTTQNSILDNQIGRQYLTNFDKYPLPLDLALPLFEWGVVFRNGQLVHLLHGLSRKTLQDTTRFSLQQSGKFRVQKGTFEQGVYLYPGDQIRWEGATPNELEDAQQLLSPQLQPKELIFYHLGNSHHPRIAGEQLKRWSQQFGN